METQKRIESEMIASVVMCLVEVASIKCEEGFSELWPCLAKVVHAMMRIYN